MHAPHFPWRTFAAWLLILLLAVLNGALRESLLVPMFGYPVARTVSGLLLLACILGVSYLLVPRIGAHSRRQLIGIGALWLVLTLVFEFIFGRVVQGKSWQELLCHYCLP